MPPKKVKLPLIGHTEYALKSRVIHSGPCIVKSIHFNNLSATSGNGSVYDGLNIKGDLKAFVTMLAYTPYPWRPGDGTDFDKGIYISLESGVSASVTYIPESRKNFI